MKTCVIDIEANGLKPTIIWLACVIELPSGRPYEFYNKEDFNEYAKSVNLWIGHNLLSFDIPVLNNLWGSRINLLDCRDTLVYSRMDNPKRDSHSLASWAGFFGLTKRENEDWSKLSEEMKLRCREDVKITRRLWDHLRERLKGQDKAIKLEHEIAIACQEMHDNGFKFDFDKALALRSEIEDSILDLDKVIHEAFPPRIIQLKTKEKSIPFNPNSPKQIIERIHEYWNPVEKTAGHIKAEEENAPNLERYKIYGWKLSEQNFATLKEEAPKAAKLLIKRLLLETRRRKLDEWLSLIESDDRIRGNFVGVGTWTHRLSHNRPNQANVAAEKSIKYKTKELANLATSLGRRFRQLFISAEDSWLVGVDAEGIQLRVLATYMGDKDFINAVTKGTKEDGTDVHSLNCKTIDLPGVKRDDAKTFIYAYVLGAGKKKIASIFNSSVDQASAAVDRFVASYAGLSKLKKEVIPNDAKRGYMVGLDGRHIKCNSPHHMLAAMLQCGEAVIVKTALSIGRLKLRQIPGWKLINFVHDELIFEVQGSYEQAEKVKKIVEEAIAEAGRVLKTNCPMSGKGSIGKNWLEVH